VWAVVLTAISAYFYMSPIFDVKLNSQTVRGLLCGRGCRGVRGGAEAGEEGHEGVWSAVAVLCAQDLAVMGLSGIVSIVGVFVASQNAIRGWWESTARKHSIKTNTDPKAGAAAQAATWGALGSVAFLYLFTVWVMGWSFYRLIDGIGDGVYNALASSVTAAAAVIVLERVFYIVA
jgi:hypothetical protein